MTLPSAEVTRAVSAEMMGIPPRSVSFLRERGFIRPVGWHGGMRTYDAGDVADMAARFAAARSRPADFNALDFETANESLSSICQVGITGVRDGGVAALRNSSLTRRATSSTLGFMVLLRLMCLALRLSLIAGIGYVLLWMKFLRSRTPGSTAGAYRMLRMITVSLRCVLLL